MILQYERFIKSAYDNYVKPTMQYANLIIPFDIRNEAGIESVITIVRYKLQEFEKKTTEELLNNNGF